MKQSIKAITLLSCIVLFQGCIDDIEPNRQKVTISFTLSSENGMISDISPDSKLVLRVESQNGEGVMEFEEVDFQYRENKFFTSPLDLPFGNYRVTDFILLNENDDIIFAVPKANAVLAKSVSRPLDYSFSFSPSSAPPDMSLRLLDVSRHQAADFGYASFKKPGWRLNVMVAVKGNTTTATSASALILNGNDTVNHVGLGAKMNHLTLPANSSENYALIISKEGYAPVRYTFAELVQTHRNKPLKVVLEPAFTMSAFIDFSVSPVFNFYLGGPDGTSITIDWGDGATEVFELGSHTEFTHPYAEPGNHPITITGEIEKIDYFYSFYGQGMVDAVDFQHLTDLREIRFGLTRSPGTIDLSNSSKLEFVMLSGLESMDALHLPEQHRISHLLIEGPSLLSTADVDAVINNLYNNTVKENIMNGVVAIAAEWYQEDESLIGPPSAEAMDKLQTMKENYGWSISPDPFE